ncbi:hypothetical protein SLS60_010265 [Paraconiothyrium brasiliense]|uniref:Uncharacterized protein n=1 Tax=Paraconiothyrium brasiliense TaxID=300254 RepID=A0ABR3QQR8_9PLEO
MKVLADQVPFARQGILGYTNALASELNETREAHLNTREMLNAKHDVHLKDLEKLKKANAKIEEIQEQVEAKANEAAEMAQQVETAKRVQDELKKDLDGRSKELAERDETIGNLIREQASLQDRLRSAEKERDQSYRETLALWKGVKETALANGVKVTALTEPVLDCIQHNFEPEAEGRKRKADDGTCAEGDVPMGSRKVCEKFRIGQAEV